MTEVTLHTCVYIPSLPTPPPPIFKMSFFLLFQDAESNRSGVDYHLKERLLLIVPKRKGPSTLCRTTCGTTKVGHEAGERKNVDENSSCGFCGKERVRPGEQG